MTPVFLLLTLLGLGYGACKLASWLILVGCLRVLAWQVDHP